MLDWEAIDQLELEDGGATGTDARVVDRLDDVVAVVVVAPDMSPMLPIIAPNDGIAEWNEKRFRSNP